MTAREKKRVYRRKYYLKHREHEKRQATEWFKKNRGLCNHRRRVRRTQTRKILERERAYRQRHKKRYQMHGRRWRERNRLARIVYMRKWRKANRPYLREQFRSWNRRHPGVATKLKRQWIRNHPLEYAARNRARNAQRKALHRGAKVTDPFILETIKGWRKQKSFVCFYCEMRFNTKKHLHIEHIAPIHFGGPHCTSNVVRSCSHCNLEKLDKTVDQWIADRRQPLKA